MNSMVNCTSDDFTNSDKSIKSLESYILKTREPLLTTLSSLQDSQHPQNCKSAFSRVKSTSTNCQELDHSDMIEQQIPSPLNKYRLNQVTISNLINNTDNTNNNSNLDSTYKSVRIDTEFNSPISDSSNPELGGTLYFSLIDILSSNSNSPSPTTYSLLPPSFHELKSDQELPEMIENEGSYEHKKGTNYPTLNEELKSGSPELKRVQSIDRGLPEKLGALHDCHHHHDPRHRFSQQLARTDLKKRAGSLTNPSLLKQFQLENRLPTQNSRIYGSSQEFLANIDTAMPMKNEACFATTHPKYHSHLTQSERKMSLNIPATIENKEVKILDKNHNNQADDMFTVFVVLLLACLNNLRHLATFLISSYFLALQFSFKFFVLSSFSIRNIALFFFLLPFTITKKCFHLFTDLIRLIL